MGSLIAAGLSAPSGLWPILLNWIQSTVINYGWTIILFTLLVKVCLFPLDFLIKYSTKKSTLIQQKCAPQVEKLKRKYGNDQQQMQLQTNAIYKREGLNMGTSCLVMLVNLVVTLLIFLSIFTSLKEVSAYKAIKQYQAINDAYQVAYESVYTGYETEALTGVDLTNETAVAAAKAESKANANKDVTVTTAVNDAWLTNKDSWLWITNIWVVDGKADALPTYSALESLAKNAGGLFGSSVNNEYVNVVNEISEADYNTVTAIVHKTEAGWNGYYILAVLSGVVTFLSTIVADLGNKLKRDKKPEKPKQNQFIKNSAAPQSATSAVQATGSTMKFMKFLMPALMIIFVLTSSSAFGIYVVTQSLIGTGMGLLTNFIVDKLTYKKQLEVREYLDKIDRKANKI